VFVVDAEHDSPRGLREAQLGGSAASIERPPEQAPDLRGGIRSGLRGIPRPLASSTKCLRVMVARQRNRDGGATDPQRSAGECIPFYAVADGVVVAYKCDRSIHSIPCTSTGVCRAERRVPDLEVGTSFRRVSSAATPSYAEPPSQKLGVFLKPSKKRSRRANRRIKRGTSGRAHSLKNCFQSQSSYGSSLRYPQQSMRMHWHLFFARNSVRSDGNSSAVRWVFDARP
jgi:hypothetical protein